MGKKIFSSKEKFFLLNRTNTSNTQREMEKKNFDETILTESKTDFGHMKFFGTLTS